MANITKSNLNQHFTSLGTAIAQEQQATANIATEIDHLPQIPQAALLQQIAHDVQALRQEVQTTRQEVQGLKDEMAAM